MRSGNKTTKGSQGSGLRRANGESEVSWVERSRGNSLGGPMGPVVVLTEVLACSQRSRSARALIVFRTANNGKNIVENELLRSHWKDRDYSTTLWMDLAGEYSRNERSEKDCLLMRKELKARSPC